MKIAIISDIHGNIAALKSVLRDIEKRNCEFVICLGDYVGYFYSAKEVVKTIMNLPNLYSIKGNHEDLLFDAIENNKLTKDLEKKYGSGHSVAISELAEEELEWLQSMSSEKVVNINGKSIGLFHGSPFSICEYVYPDSDRALFQKIEELSLDVILMGHTHHQFVKYGGSTLIINPGSVGQARDVRGLASYAILDSNNLTVRPIRVDYQKEKLVKSINHFESNPLKLLTSIGEK